MVATLFCCRASIVAVAALVYEEALLKVLRAPDGLLRLVVWKVVSPLVDVI
jgi:hypothetical protein